MSKPTVLATCRLLPHEMKDLEERFNTIVLWREGDPEGVIQAHKEDIQAIATNHVFPIRKELMEALPNLEIISTNSVGTNHIDLETAKERDIKVCNTPDVLSECTADTALCLMLAVMRRICEGDLYVRVGKWFNGDMPLGRRPRGKLCGIVGLGRIGKEIAKRCEAFGMEIAYHGRTKQDVPYRYYPDLTRMAEDCDVLILSCPGGPETANLVDSHILEALGPQGFLINVSRGTVVDEPALVAALQGGVIAGAGLDVFLNEPDVPPELISMDNVVLLPHIGSATIETRTEMGRLVVDNIAAHFEGKSLLSEVKI